MPNTNGTAAVAEQEQTDSAMQQQQSQPPPVKPTAAQEMKEFLLHLSLPPMWTEEHYTKFTTAEMAARARGVDIVLARYYGVLALFRAGDVRIVNLPKLEELLSKSDADQKYVPLAVKGALIRAVANPLEAAVDQPFLDFLRE